MNFTQIKESFVKKSFRIINIIKNKNYKYDTTGNELNFFEENMEMPDIIFFFSKLDSLIADDGPLSFVILNEFFFLIIK